MPKACALPNCYNKHGRDKVKFYAVPGNTKRRKFWLKMVPYLRRYSSIQSLNNVKICQDHFIPEHFNEQKKLTEDAYPSLPPDINTIYSDKYPEMPERAQIRPVDFKNGLIPESVQKQERPIELRLQISPLIVNKPLSLEVIKTFAPISNDNQAIFKRKEENVFVSQEVSKIVKELILDEDSINDGTRINFSTPVAMDTTLESMRAERTETNAIRHSMVEDLEIKQNASLTSRKKGTGLHIANNVIKEDIYNFEVPIEKYLLEDISMFNSNVLNQDPKNKHRDSDGLSSRIQVGYACNKCSDQIHGFRYTCVECLNYDLCNTCEANGEHEEHYMLRIPGRKSYGEIKLMLDHIRKLLLSTELNPETDTAFCNEDCIKLEIKEETDVTDPLEVHKILLESTDDDDTSSLVIESSMDDILGTEGDSNTKTNQTTPLNKKLISKSQDIREKFKSGSPNKEIFGYAPRTLKPAWNSGENLTQCIINPNDITSYENFKLSRTQTLSQSTCEDNPQQGTCVNIPNVFNKENSSKVQKLRAQQLTHKITIPSVAKSSVPTRLSNQQSSKINPIRLSTQQLSKSVGIKLLNDSSVSINSNNPSSSSKAMIQLSDPKVTQTSTLNSETMQKSTNSQLLNTSSVEQLVFKPRPLSNMIAVQQMNLAVEQFDGPATINKFDKFPT